MTLVALFVATTLGLSAQKPMKAPKGGMAISDELIGIFLRTSTTVLMVASMPNSSKTARSSFHQLKETVGERVPHGNRRVQAIRLVRWRFARARVFIPTILLT